MEVKGYTMKALKPMKKEIEEDTRRLKDHMFNIVKMAVSPKAMCKLKSIPNKTATLFFTEMGMKTLKLICGQW